MSEPQPEIVIVNGYEIIEYPVGHYVVMTSDGPYIDLKFPTFQGAADYAGTQPPGPRSNPLD